MLTKAISVPAIIGLFLLVTTFGAPSTARAEYPAAEELTLSQQCTSPFTVGVVLGWTSYGVGEQWIDLSYYNNDWAPDTYATTGPLPYYQTAYAGDGLTPAATYYIRVNTLIDEVWYPSETYTFETISDCEVHVVFVPVRVIVPIPPQ